MHHFFVSQEQISEKEIKILGQDVRHIRQVLRMEEGEELLVGDGEGREYLCQIQKIEEKAEIAWILEQRDSQTELPSEITLYQGLPKGDKMELIVQKTVELGVSRIVPVEMKRCVVKLDQKKAAKKRERWSLIAESAAKQSKRGRIPEVSEVKNFAQALQESSGEDVLLIPYECAENMGATRAIIEQIKPGSSVGIWIGPEGGFEEEEIEALKNCGGNVLTLGKRILRTETAGLAMLAILMYHLER